MWKCVLIAVLQNITFSNRLKYHLMQVYKFICDIRVFFFQNVQAPISICAISGLMQTHLTVGISNLPVFMLEYCTNWEMEIRLSSKL